MKTTTITITKQVPKTGTCFNCGQKAKYRKKIGDYLCKEHYAERKYLDIVETQVAAFALNAAKEFARGKSITVEYAALALIDALHHIGRLD